MSKKPKEGSSVATTIANQTSTFLQPRHPLARIDYEFTSMSINFGEGDDDVPTPEAERVRRSCVVELVPLEHSPALSNSQFEQAWADWARCLTDNAAAFKPGWIRSRYLRTTLDYGVLPELFMATFHDSEHINGINTNVNHSTGTPFSTHSHAIRFDSQEAWLDIFRIERIA